MDENIVNVTYPVSTLFAILLWKKGPNPLRPIATPFNKCAEVLQLGYDNTLCSLSGRPYTLLPRVPKDHPVISEENLIRKKDLLNPLADPIDIDFIDEKGIRPSNCCP
jgi:hypothetical protein